jgi:serine/threonine-protein kinase
VLAGRYQLGARRGSGVDAAVFDAVDLQSQQLVAIKLVHPDLSADADVQRQFRAAMERVAEIRHPTIAAPLDWGTETWNGRPVLFVVVEHLGGGTLRDLLDRGRLLSPSQALLVGLDACRALDVVHRNGLVHGDIRPSTLVFGDDRRLRLADVGLASLLVEHLWADPSRMPNARAAYAAPETATSGERGAPADVYALCLTLMEAVTGHVPFAGDSTVATLANRVDRLLPVSADLGPMATVLERAGRPDPAQRSTAAELGRAFVQVAEKLPRPAPLPLPGGGLFDPRGTDPTGPIRRPAVAAPTAPDTSAPDTTAPGTFAPGTTAPGTTAPDTTRAADASRPTAQAPRPPVEPAPRRRRRVSWRVVVPSVAVLLALVLALVWVVTRPDTSQVPNLAGLTEAEALNQVAGRGWSTIVTREASDTVPTGQVIRTQPPAGSTLAEGDDLQLVVSSGPAPRALPDLTGLTVAEATSLLEAQDLVIAQADPVYDETVPAGSVVSWSVPEQPNLHAGDTVTKGTTVRVVPSAGPAPRQVPDLTGLTLDAAGAALTVLGLGLTQLPDEFSATVPAGQVARQEPVAGQSVARGSTVAVALSKGPDLVSLPVLGGLAYPAIVTALEGAGFVVGTVNGDTALSFTGAQVGGVAVGAGQQFPRGTAVDLFFG